MPMDRRRHGTAANGIIRGRVELRQAPSDNAPRVSVADLGMGNTHEPPDRRSVVYLDPAPRAAFDTQRRNRVRGWTSATKRSCRTCCRSSPGRRWIFPNNDHTYHNVFSLSKTKTFDLGRYAVGRSKSVRFDRPGIVRVFCDIHSHMSAFILVFAHRYFSLSDSDGATGSKTFHREPTTSSPGMNPRRSNPGASSCRTQEAKSK